MGCSGPAYGRPLSPSVMQGQTLMVYHPSIGACSSVARGEIFAIKTVYACREQVAKKGVCSRSVQTV